ncbi:putative bifunctional diguanylate cyclase/phosphodiesterase [Caloranaerobacter azorensis]|uniref:Bifunctional diguanylate cyclase/phosphodiesterase n=1 Tax=Caloranaerobacter azorensis TaxID=116090 RepID=A0A6P1YCR9_9FIRM|nr:bifunctional diguanylate cyclase/phosphodiesterase [Caloranaerobacter azorensis]QIB27100.1 bifunctional diguanylate cyclase/phosphodiesterase [Caloranaerobacter azorensis]
MKLRSRLHYFDRITGLPNRQYLYKYFSKNISEFIVILLDIDDFKYANGTFGHKFGDKYLKAFSIKISKILGEEGDVFFHNGDEFLIFLPKLGLEMIDSRIESLFKKLQDSFKVEGREIYNSVSMGVYITKENDSIDDAIRKAEAAMYIAKRKGKGHYRYFDENVEKDAMKKIIMVNELRKAITRNELYLLYQPILDIKENKILEVEALLRWKNGELGEVSPVDFIPIAEETGLIREIGYWVIRKACNQIKKWENENVNLKVAINISPNQFDDKDFFYNVKNIVTREKVDFSKIKFEITETQILKLEKRNMKRLMELTKMGAVISLDDFGVGYSSLKNLVFFPVSELKIDKSFIDNININKKIEKLISSILFMAYKMGYKVTAEGVERKEQLDKLLEYGCDKIQGYYIGKPMIESDIIEILQRSTII